MDPRLEKEDHSGTFVIPKNGNLSEFQGTYRCFASNNLGTAISEDMDFIVPSKQYLPPQAPHTNTLTRTHIPTSEVLLLQFKALLLLSRPVKASVMTVRQSGEPSIVSAMAESH